MNIFQSILSTVRRPRTDQQAGVRRRLIEIAASAKESQKSFLRRMRSQFHDYVTGAV